MKSFLHWLGFHTWGKWSEPWQYISIWSIQERRCGICNMVQCRKYDGEVRP